MPIEKISANRDTRLRVKPIAQDANRVSDRVSTTAVPITSASRRPSANSTSSTTAEVAKNSFLISVVALSLAVSPRSEEHTSELQSLMRISYAVFCLTKKNHTTATDEVEHTTLYQHKHLSAKTHIGTSQRTN